MGEILRDAKRRYFLGSFAGSAAGVVVFRFREKVSRFEVFRIPGCTESVDRLQVAGNVSIPQRQAGAARAKSLGSRPARRHPTLFSYKPGSDRVGHISKEHGEVGRDKMREPWPATAKTVSSVVPQSPDASMVP